jgi:hypothetical protein
MLLGKSAVECELRVGFGRLLNFSATDQTEPMSDTSSLPTPHYSTLLDLFSCQWHQFWKSRAQATDANMPLARCFRTLNTSVASEIARIESKTCGLSTISSCSR